MIIKGQETEQELLGLQCFTKIKEEVRKYKLIHNIYPVMLIIHPDKFKSLLAYTNHLSGTYLPITKDFSFYALQISTNIHLPHNKLILSCLKGEK
jgi:hypothetical protein